MAKEKQIQVNETILVSRHLTYRSHRPSFGGDRMTEVKHMIKKICVVGEAAVGKTSLIRRFVLDKFDDRYISTIGTKTSAKDIKITLNRKGFYLTLQIWDILGLRCFSKLQKRAYKGAKGAFIVIDITRRETLRSFGDWLVSLYKVAGEIPVVVLGNKNDVEAEIGRDEIEKVAMEYGFPYYITSARTGENVKEAFHTLGKLLVTPWEGKKIVLLSEKSEAKEREYEPEMEPGRKLSIYEVEDIIMARYCDLLEDPDFAMAVVRQQFKRADVNFICPTVEGLRKAVDYLINAASGQVENNRLDKEREAYRELIKRTGG
jgi:small GTP-binding protein